jgi:hypothetical protein
MRTVGSLVFLISATLALWAQATPEGAAKGKAKGKASVQERAPTPPPVPQVLRLVRPSTYLVTGHGTNSIFRVTPQGVLLVDTKLAAPGDYERLAELIRGITPQPVKFVFNTSSVPGASGNNAKFLATGAELVATERTVTLGGAEARVLKVGANAVVYFPSEKLICLGEVPKNNEAVQKLDWTLAIPSSGEPVYR